MEEGDHSSLLRLNGEYAKMYNQQMFSFPAAYSQKESIMNDRQEQFDGNEKPTHSPAESVFDDHDSGPPLPDFHGHAMSLVSCLIVIFREHHKMRNILLLGCIACITAGAVYPGQAVVFAKSIAVLSQKGGELVRNGTFWALLWFILAIGVCLTFLVFSTIFNITASTIVRAYRHEYFSSMMEQDPAFFAAEANSSAALTARLISYTQQLEILLSKTIGSILIVSVNVVSSCVLLIAIAWRLGLVAVFGAFPLICLAGYL